MSRQNLPASGNETDDTFFPSFQREMNRFIDQFRHGFPFGDSALSERFSGSAFPAMDVRDKGDSLEITVEVPGVSEKDIDVTITGDVLSLKGEKTAEKEEKKDNYQRVERRYGAFRRQVPLGFTPDDGAVSSEFGDGVLKLTIAKPETAKPSVQKIDITRK